MTEPNLLLLKTNLKQLRLPTMNAEFEALARQATAANESYPQYLLRLTEVEVAARSANVLKALIKAAQFPAAKATLDGIEHQQAANVLAQQTGGPFVLQVPFLAQLARKWKIPCHIFPRFRGNNWEARHGRSWSKLGRDGALASQSAGGRPRAAPAG